MKLCFTLIIQRDIVKQWLPQHLMPFAFVWLSHVLQRRYQSRNETPLLVWIRRTVGHRAAHTWNYVGWSRMPRSDILASVVSVMQALIHSMWAEYPQCTRTCSWDLVMRGTWLCSNNASGKVDCLCPHLEGHSWAHSGWGQAAQPWSEELGCVPSVLTDKASVF